MLHVDLHRRLCLARDLLREIDDSPQSVRAVARRTGFSTFHFIRLFKAVFGQTPHQCQSYAQIERAKILLLAKGASVTDVCMAVGFTSLGSFSALFSKRVGISPSGFQERYREARLEAGMLPHALMPGCFSLMGGAPANSAISEKRLFPEGATVKANK